MRGLVVHHHLIISDDGVDLIDGGFIGGLSRIKRTLQENDQNLGEIRNLFLTHGHLDHTLNIARLKKLTGCRVLAPDAERHRFDRSYRPKGWSRIGACLEAMGRFLLRFEKPIVDHWFHPGDIINGLEVISLPGHTFGHCGFLLRGERILLAGDLFANHFGRPSCPPAIFNDNGEEARRSIIKAAELDLQEVFLNHGGKTSGQAGLRALIDLANGL